MSQKNHSVAVIADAKLRFETNAALTNRWWKSGKNRVAGDRKNYFQFRFGIRAKDGNVYPFTLTLFNVLLPGIEGIQENYLTLLPPNDYPGITVEEEVVLGGAKVGQTFNYFGKLEKVKKGNVLSWKINPIPEGLQFKTRTCSVKVQLSGSLSEDWQKTPLLEFISKKRDTNLKIVCEEESTPPKPQFASSKNKKQADNQQSETLSRKKVGEYWVNKTLIIKESEVFETMLSGVNEWEESMQYASGSNIDKFITVSDTKRVALEAYLVFCYSGYVPMSAIGQDLAAFADKYRITNLMVLIDKFVSMHVVKQRAGDPSTRGYEDNGINAWIKWIPKLDMKNSALQIQHWRPWGKKAYRHVMERNYDFSGYLYKNRGDSDYPAYSYLVGNLTFSENFMINKD